MRRRTLPRVLLPRSVLLQVALLLDNRVKDLEDAVRKAGVDLTGELGGKVS